VIDTNLCLLVGEIADAPESRVIDGGKHKLSLRVVTRRDTKERTFYSYHSVVAWGRLADAFATAMQKGQRVLVKGELSTRSYEKYDRKQYVTEVVAQELAILGVASARPAQQALPMGSTPAARAAPPEPDDFDDNDHDF